MRTLLANFARLRTEAGDAGMSTVEYAVGTLAAVGLAGVLLKVLTSDHMKTTLAAVIEGALK